MTVVDRGHAADLSVLAEFQSLFLWMTVVDRPVLLSVPLRQIKFQSLFLWMTVVDSPGTGRSFRRYQVSILVLVDDGRRLDRDQSGTSADRSFNPCSCG